MITILKKDKLINEVFEYDTVLLPIDINNSMSKGFSKEASVNFKGLKELEAKHGYGDKRKYGKTYSITLNAIEFCFCYSIKNNIVDIDLLNSCLDLVKDTHSRERIAISIPIHEEWSKDILSLLESKFKNSEIKLCVYYDEDEDFNLKYYHRFQELRKKFKSTELTKEEYSLEKRQLNWERKNGIYNKMPEGWVEEKDQTFSFLKK